MSFDAVRRWRDRLRAGDVGPYVGPLSREGLALVLSDAVEALHDAALDAVAALPGTPFATAAMAVPRTVPTAPIEWCAVLLGRGTEVVLKPPAGVPGLVPRLVEAARAEGLPLRAGEGHAALDGAELIVVMGDDDTVRAVTQAHPRSRVLGFGHTWSVAVAEGDEGIAAVAMDAARFDGRGCLSPVALLTPRPLDEACAVLAAAMAEAERRVPRGTITDDEGAAIRTRRALAKVEGIVHEGATWSVHGLPASRLTPVGLPRSLVVHSVPADVVEVLLAPHSAALSTVGTDGVPPAWAHVRVCKPGDMQRPTLVRLHDGVDWIAATLRDSADQTDKVHR